MHRISRTLRSALQRHAVVAGGVFVAICLFALIAIFVPDVQAAVPALIAIATLLLTACLMLSLLATWPTVTAEHYLRFARARLFVAHASFFVIPSLPPPRH